MPPPQPVIWPERVVILGGAHGSLALARSLGKLGVSVCYITSDSPLAGWSRYVSKAIRWPGPEAPGAVAALLDIARQNNLTGALLVAASDPDVKLVSQHAQELSSTFRIMLPAWEQLQWLCDKPRLYRRAAELGLAFPKTYAIATLDEALRLEPLFPLVLKPNMGGGTSALARAKVMRIDDRASFIATFREAAGELGAANIVVQQLIPGGGECQFSYAALWSAGQPVAEFTARRSRQYPIDFGFTSTFVETVDMPEVTVAARKVLASVGYSGLAEIEFKRDPRNGVLNILDVNPRPWSWFGLCAAAGMDLGQMMWQVATGKQPPETGPARPAIAWMYLARDTVSSALLMARGSLGFGAYLASFPKVRAGAAFAWSDLKPGLADLPLTVFRVVARRISKRPKPDRSRTAPSIWSLQSLKSTGKYGIVRAGLNVSAAPVVQGLFPQARGRGVIFTLHHVRPESRNSFDPNAILSITPEFLEEAIAVCTARGLVPVHLHDLPALLADPSDTRSFVAFTLDDGYRNNAEYAAPVFRKFNVPYTIFINPGFVERRRTMWWETAAALVREASAFECDFGQGPETVACATPAQKIVTFDRLATLVRSIDEDEAVRRIDAAAQAHGISPMAIVDELVMTEAELQSLSADPLVHFGAHTVNHINMRRASAERLAWEIGDSIATIETYVGRRPLSFSYPYGWATATGEREAEAVGRAGIGVAVTTQPGVLNAARLLKPRELPRVSLNGHYQKKRYVEALLSGIPFKLMGMA